MQSEASRSLSKQVGVGSPGFNTWDPVSNPSIYPSRVLALKRSLKKVWTFWLLTFAFMQKNVAALGLEIPTPVCQCKPILCFQSQGKMKPPLVYYGLGMSRTLLNAYECVISSNWSGLGPTDPPGGFGDVGRNSHIAIAIYATHATHLVENENDSTTDLRLILEVPWFYRHF